MTTNVRDSISGILATDSRWTWTARLDDGQTLTRYLDDTGYEKLVTAAGHAFMFAGDACVIEKWKKSIKIASSEPWRVDWLSLPVDGMAISAVKTGSGDVAYECGHDISIEQVSFAGTGSYAAARCWIQNKCAVRAVETAKNADKHTGGTVRHYNVQTFVGNVVQDIGLDDLIRQFTGGSDMAEEIKHSSNMAEVADRHEKAANDDVAVRQAFLAAYANGQGPTAPCDAVFKKWPGEEHVKLVKAMKNIFAV